jgi:hypothetical protein
MPVSEISNACACQASAFSGLPRHPPGMAECGSLKINERKDTWNCKLFGGANKFIVDEIDRFCFHAAFSGPVHRQPI